MSNPTFEESIDTIDSEINRHRHKWNLSIVSWMDFDDVSQIIRIHIYRKWEQYDPIKPLAPWLYRIISNQIKNIIRNIYGNYCRPCLRCAAAEGEDGCRIYEKQCSGCPLYANWEKTKKNAHDTKLPVSLENHQQEVHNMFGENLDIEASAKQLHLKMEKVLKPAEWTVYKSLYIDHKKEEDVAKQMGYRTSEIGRQPGYKQIKNMKKAIMAKVNKVVYSGEIDLM